LTTKIKESPTAILDRQIKQAQLAKTQKETSLLGVKDTEDDVKAKKAEDTNIKNLKEKITAITLLEGSKGMAGTVGAYGISRWTPLTIDKSQKQDFIAGVKNLVSQDTLDTLLELKKAGGTLGAISEKELDILQSAASKINNWAITDKNGKVTGYEIGEKEFRAELDRIKKSAQKIVDAYNGEDYIDTVDNTLKSNFTSNIYQSAGYSVE
jgi:hypothetical protein